RVLRCLLGWREGKSGRSSENKAPFVVAVQKHVKKHPTAARFDRVKAFTGEEIKRCSVDALAQAQVISDGLVRFRAVTATTKSHGGIITSSGRKAVKVRERH
ncbi:MAG: hypothetical protein ACI9Y1_003151, partial [Lentisphaeria bacterium]